MKSDRLAVLTEEAREILQGAMDEKRRDLNPDEERRWQSLYREICELRGTTPMTPTTPTAAAGEGWRVIDTADDRALQIVSEQIWHHGFRSRWPEGWSVRFGSLPPGDAARTFFYHKLIVIDLDNYRRCGDVDLEKSLHHELAHLAWRALADHGDSRFEQTIADLWHRVPRLIPAWRRAG